jgi:hypothetical protein
MPTQISALQIWRIIQPNKLSPRQISQASVSISEDITRLEVIDDYQQDLGRGGFA